MNIKDYRIWLVYAGALLALAAGSFYDLPISMHLYDPYSYYAKFMAAYGQLPVLWGLLAAAITAWRLLEDDRPGLVIKGVILLLGLAGYIYGAYAAWKVYASWLCLLGVVVFFFVPPALFCLLIRGVSRKRLWSFIKFCCFVCLVQFVIVTVMKEIWMRPRFYIIRQYSQIPFVPWWDIASPYKAEYMNALKISSDGFKSFPSAHTSCAACVLCVAGISKVNRKLKNWKWPVFLASLLVPAAVAIGRIIAGAHYLSDTAAGFLITFTVFLIGWRLFFGKTRLKKKTADPILPAVPEPEPEAEPSVFLDV